MVSQGIAIPHFPLITPAPIPTLVHQALKRQADENRICGYESGIRTSSLVCSGSNICLNNGIDRRGCCSAGECTLPTTCLDSSVYLASCDFFCQYDSLTAGCTESENPFCGVGIYTDNSESQVTQVVCVSEASQTVSFALTYDGAPGASQGSQGSQGGVDSDTSSSGSSSAATGSSQGIAQSDNEGENLTGPGLSQGAIIAIAVCTSILGLALIGLVIWLVRRRSKKTTPPPVPNMDQDMTNSFVPPGSTVANSSPYQDFRPYNENFQSMDDDAVANLRRLSNDGTIDQTVVTRTNDNFRPQAP